MVFGSVPFAWDILNDYIQNYRMYEDMIHFCEKWKLLQIIEHWNLNDPDIRETAEAMIRINHNTRGYDENYWVSYNDLESVVSGDLEMKLKRAMELGMLIKEGNDYSFKPQAFPDILIGLGWDDPLCY